MSYVPLDFFGVNSTDFACHALTVQKCESVCHTLACIKGSKGRKKLFSKPEKQPYG